MNQLQQAIFDFHDMVEHFISGNLRIPVANGLVDPLVGLEHLFEKPFIRT